MRTAVEGLTDVKYSVELIHYGFVRESCVVFTIRLGGWMVGAFFFEADTHYLRREISRFF